MKIKLEWPEFVDAAMVELRRKYPNLRGPKFLYFDGMYEVDTLPTYVEIEIVRNKK